jgi:hypothetical protein
MCTLEAGSRHITTPSTKLGNKLAPGETFEAIVVMPSLEAAATASEAVFKVLN